MALADRGLRAFPLGPGPGAGVPAWSRPGVDGLGLVAVGVAGAALGPLIRPGPQGGGSLDLHDLVEQDSHGGGEAAEAVLGQEFRDLVEGGSLALGGSSSVVSLGSVAPSKGTGGGPPLQDPSNLQNR